MASQGGGWAPGSATGLHHPGGGCHRQTSPSLTLSGCTWRWWWGGGLCACVSAPYLFSLLLILVPPAAPHTKPHSPNPQGVGKGGQLHYLPLGGQYPCCSTGSSPSPGAPALLWTLPEVSTCKDFQAPFPFRSGPVLSTFWFLVVDTPQQVCPRALRG